MTARVCPVCRHPAVPDALTQGVYICSNPARHGSYGNVNAKSEVTLTLAPYRFRDRKPTTPAS